MAFVPNKPYRPYPPKNPPKITSKHGKHPYEGILKSPEMSKLAERAGLEVGHRAVKKLRDITKNVTINGKITIGVVPNGDKSFVNNAHDEVSYHHTVSAAQQSVAAESKIYKNTLNIGIPSSSTLKEFGRNRTVDTKRLVDTERDFLSTQHRRSLTGKFGFNQRSYDFLIDDTFMKVKDFKFLFSNHEKSFKTRLSNKNIYGNIFYESLNLRIKSETDYYSTRFKLHLVKITNPEISVKELVKRTFNAKSEVSPLAVPVDRQLSPYKQYGNFRVNILTDLKCTLSQSDFFKDNAKVVKTFSRVLGPQDIWDFKYYLHYGPGILLNKIYEEAPKSPSHPVGYFFIVQSEGDPRASMTRTSDNENFNGSSPGRFNYQFTRSLKFIKEPGDGDEVFTTREFISYDEDFENEKLQNYFTPNRETKVNVNFSKINTNRVEDKKLPYQLRYGEGRLTVYMDPALQRYIARANASESSVETADGNYVNTTSIPDDEEDSEIFDPNKIGDDHPNLRGQAKQDEDDKEVPF